MRAATACGERADCTVWEWRIGRPDDVPDVNGDRAIRRVTHDCARIESGADSALRLRAIWEIPVRMDCWICGSPATTGEHKTKQSDLQAVFGMPSQAQPLYYHDKSIRNRPIGSYKGDFLKSPSRLCAPCNNQKTQPHDRAWARLSGRLRIRTPPLRAGEIVRADRVYPLDARRDMRNVHLFFTKLTGCHLVEAGLKFDQAALAQSILTDKTNPYIHLKVGLSREGLPVGMSDLHAATLVTDNSLAFAVWIYSLGDLVVHVMYSIANEERDGLIGAWHPRFGTNRLVIADFP